MKICWPLMLCSLLMLFGCSFKASRPAPVENLSHHSNFQNRSGSSSGSSYTVKKGDTLYSISWGVGRDFNQVARENNLRAPYTIYPGQVLQLIDRTQIITPAVRSQVSSTRQSEVLNQPGVVRGGEVKSDGNQPSRDSSVPFYSQNNVEKKELDHKVNNAYSVTTTQQIINQTDSGPVADLPKNVQQWRWPVQGRVISHFSATEQGNQGIKISGSRGSIISAAADGRVVYAGNALRGYGHLVIIKHNDDFLSAYAHADTILVKEKQYVNVGQAIAKMGSTGTHQVMLHFEIRYHGKSINPLKYLPKQ